MTPGDVDKHVRLIPGGRVYTKAGRAHSSGRKPPVRRRPRLQLAVLAVIVMALFLGLVYFLANAMFEVAW